MPPNSSSLASFWRFLLRGGNALKPVKKDRWDWRQFYDEDQKRPGKSYQPKGAFLDADIQQFDPMVFGISPREAASMDPQQRLLLESAWEAFEDAGIPIASLSGSPTGVFIGGFCLDHLALQMQPSNRHLANANSAAGVMMTILSNRISHVFNLRGPSLTLDTACSSSLVAVHYACQSLRLRECDMALAGGVNVMNRPDFPVVMSKGHFLSHHGECRTFDESAAGYARGEGAGVFVIKRCEDAVAAGDTIHAVIRGTGVNQDGHTDGISLPNSAAQEELVREVYRKAGVPPAEVDYIEAHGTGTQAGDPAEARALHVNFAEGRGPESKLIVGSVKSNIGHLEAAAGVAGILKAIGVLKHRQVPKNLHFDRPNPKIPFDEYCLRVTRETAKLPAESEKPTLYAGINSFGYGGTNAHVLLESAPSSPDGPNGSGESGALRLIPFSAASEEALRDLVGKYAFQIGSGLPGSFSDLAYTTAHRRSHLPWRIAAVAGGLDELREQLIAASTGQPHEGMSVSAKAAEAPSGLAFVYTGMGPQWWAMGQELIREEPIVAAAVDEIDAHFQKLAGWSLKEAMLADEPASKMARTEVAQPANFALQVALTRLWESYGIRPAAVVGHSVGEVTSAYVAGVYTLEEAVSVSYHRSHLQQTLAGCGSMLAVGLPQAEAEACIVGLPGVSVAAVNSFSAVTLSGDSEQLGQLAADLEKRGVFNKFLRVEVAYHSPQMDPLREKILTALSGLAPKPARIPLYSTAYGKVVPAEMWDAEYWWRNVRQAVLFADAMAALFADGCSSFIEVGPHPVLGNSIKECAVHLERRVKVYTSLVRKEPERRRMLLALGELYCAGFEPDWTALAPRRGHFIPGPQYPWQRKTHWNESERSRMERLGLPGPVYLNRTVLGPSPCWEVEVNRNYFPFLFDHGVQDQTVFAGMGYIEAALALSRHLHGRPAVVLENVSFERVLIVDYAKLQYLIAEFDAEAGRFSISSRVEGDEQSVQRHCRGRIYPLAEPVAPALDLAQWKADCPEEVAVDAFYERLARRGLHYGPAFRPTTDAQVGDGCFFLRIDASGIPAEDHPLHPTLFDAVIQPVLYCARGDRLFVPFSIEKFEYFSAPEPGECFAVGRLIEQTDTLIVADVWLANARGEVHAHAGRLSCQVIETEVEHAEQALYYDAAWKPAPLDTDGALDGAGVLVLANSGDGLAAEIAEGAAVVSRDPAEWREFAKEDFAKLLTSADLANRNRIVVLWGTDASAEPDSALAGRAVAFFQALADSRSKGAEVTLVTRGAKSVEPGEGVPNLAACALSSIGLVAQNEFSNISCRSIDLPEKAGAFDAACVRAELAASSEGDIAWRNGQRFEMRLGFHHEPADEERFVSVSVEEPVALGVGPRGKVESLHYERAERREPGEGEIELRVHMLSLNYKDLLKIEGRLHPLAMEGTFNGHDFGMEVAGVVLRAGPGSRFKPGDRVVTMLRRGFGTYAIAPDVFANRIPDGLGMEAAGIPVVYQAAYRGLVDVARLAAGERVLIHHASGGLGLAAVDIAKWLGAEIFATAGSEEKRQFLRDLGIRHVFSSRDFDFGPRIREVTNGEGVDVVIGAQTGQAMHASLGLLRSGGRYVEVGKKDIAEDNGLPLRAFNRNVTFASVDMDRLMAERPLMIRETLERIFGHFAKGDFKLGPSRVFPGREIREAFQEMARSRHVGKLLVDLSAGEVDVPDRPAIEPVIRRDGCYVVTGGTAGFGLAVGQWLAEQGAGRILLVSRSGKKAAGLGEAIPRMEAHGAKVEVHSVDVSDLEQVRALVETASTGRGPLRGIVHGAMVLDDAMMADVTAENFQRVFGPKAGGALNLAEALEGRPPLDFLVFHSSISAVVGNRGQTSYVAANSVLDALAHALRARGVPATSINWGALAESGVVARDGNLGALLSTGGITGLTDREAFAALEKAIRLGAPRLGVFKVDWSKWHEAHPHLARDPRFADLQGASGDGANDAASQIRSALAESSREQRLLALEGHLLDALADTLKMSRDSISTSRKLNEMGVDSLMVLELSLGIEDRVGVSFSAMEFLKGPTLQQLAAMAEAKLWKN